MEQLFSHTKIVATLGPATPTEDSLRELLEAGVNVCRINFSHGTIEQHAETLARVRRISAELGRAIAVLGDLCGPKIRLNTVADGIALETGQDVTFVRGDAVTKDAKTLTISYPQFVDEVNVGERVYIDDGLVRLLVTDREPDAIRCRCTVGGPISSRKGVNLPDTKLSVSAITDKDRADARWAIESGLDYVALSFVRTPADLAELRSHMASIGTPIPVIVKIEKTEALDYLDEFIAAADGVMIARGDLGVEMDIWRVPLVQKVIAQKCRAAGKPVIVATQMLQSMVGNPSPTRAEVSDVANAILDGTDAVMLSAESASGQYPIQSVVMMRRIAIAAEAYLAKHGREDVTGTVAASDRITSAISHGAIESARHLGAKLVAAWTSSGNTVRLLAKYRLDVPVVGLTSDIDVFRRLALLFGVIPIQVPGSSNPAEMAQTLDRVLLEKDLAQVGDLVIVVTSTNPHVKGKTDATLVHRVAKLQ